MSQSAYTSLAAVYDALNSGVDYSAWVDYIEGQFKKYAPQARSVLDLACGTGTITAILASRGYDMTGIDLSEEMLSVARQKCDSERFPHKVLLVRQNMTELELYGTVNAVVCCLDSLNYLTDTSSLTRALSHVHTYLEPDGVFVFDMNAPAKFERVYGDNSYVLEEDGLLCAWQNYYNQKTKLCDFYLSIFRECEDGRWERYDEEQRERCYSLRTIKKLLTETGFELLELSGGLNGEPVDEDTERWYFTVRRI
ncbi:MAG: class I SAM-dependent methyltransferase [Clostridiales bacterium]|nr:class I SAM-dependent methyltransferase [Clostridiales bacterium]